MAWSRICRHACFVGLALIAVMAVAQLALAQPLSDEQLLDGADARIEKHRKGDAVIVVVDGDGNPVVGAGVEVEQTRHAFLFGCNIFKWGRVGDPALETAYRDRFASLLNYATQPFYWWSYERRRGQPRHEHTRRVAQWCREHGIATKGHPLAWNHSDASWYPDDTSTLRRLQMERIDDCVTRFEGLIDRWDVVNEATQFDRPMCVERAPKFTAMWKEIGQIEFTRECFRHARRANSEATLLINDYRTGEGYERLIEKLVNDRGEPLYDVVGIQSHMHGGTWSNRKTWDVCERFSRFDVPLHFTEVTILSGEKGWRRPRPWKTTPAGEQYQAREVVRFYTMLFSHPAVEAITWWDFSDRGAWQGAPAGLVRADMTPKPAYDALIKLIKQQWWTRDSLQTDAAGTASFRGFLGDYRVTVRVPGQEPVEITATLTKGDNRWTARIEENQRD